MGLASSQMGANGANVGKQTLNFLFPKCEQSKQPLFPSHSTWHTSLQSLWLHLSTPLTSSNGQRVLAQLAVALLLTKFLPRSRSARPNTVRMQSSGNDGPLLLSSFSLLNLAFNWIINGNWSAIRSNILQCIITNQVHNRHYIMRR